MHARTESPEETERLGARLARALPPSGTELAVLYLTGGLGAGKTTLARGFAGALGIEGPVRSPSYTLLQVYPFNSGTLVHLDLYRVQMPAELDSIGLRDFAKPEHLWLIEWPERGTGHLPPADLTATLAAGDSWHEIKLAAYSALGKSWLVQVTGAGVQES